MREKLIFATVRGDGKFTEINESLITYSMLGAVAFILTIIIIRSYMSNKNSKNGKI